MEFHLFRIFEYFANLLNSKNRLSFQIVRLLEFLFKLLIQARNDVWSVESMDWKGKIKSQNSSHFSALTQNYHFESELKSDLKNSKNRFLYF